MISKTAKISEKRPFPGTNRIKTREDFLRIQSRGKKTHTRHFILVWSKASSKATRLGITITTKIDKRAVLRNKVKRAIREFFRVYILPHKPEIDLVVIAKQGSTKLTTKEVREEILIALQRNAIIP